MVRQGAAIAVVLLLAVVPAAVAPAQAPHAGSPYGSLLQRLRQGDRTVDFGELRLAYTETEIYAPYAGPTGDIQEMLRAMDERRFDAAIESSEKILARKNVDIHAHFAAYVAFRETGAGEKADFHKYVFDGLLKSILASGDGKTPQTAFVVISTDEEYALLGFLGLRPVQQALLPLEGRHYDEITARNPRTDDTVKLYFNVDRPLGWLEKQYRKR